MSNVTGNRTCSSTFACRPSKRYVRIVRYMATLNWRHITFGRTFIDICFVAPVDVKQLEHVYCVRSRCSAAVYLH
jgi:hypothetical protein